MKRRIGSFIMAVLMVLNLLPAARAAGAAVVASGYCGGEEDGTNLTWTLTADGTLTISGQGEMRDYRFYPPWLMHLHVFPSPSFGYYLNDIVRVVIEPGVTSIGEGAFGYCDTLEELEIADSVTRIGAAAFCCCISLTEVTIPAGMTEIGDSTFFNCLALSEVSIPDGVTEIGPYAFAHCNSLKKVEIPDSVTQIQFNAFYGCKSLSEVNIPNGLNEIEEEVFCSCALTEISIPDSVTEIGYGAFAHCELTGVDLPENLIKIGDYAFNNCDFSEVHIPAGVEEIGNCAFKTDSGLERITLDEGNPYFVLDRSGVLYDMAKTRLFLAPNGLEGSYIIPASVTEIGGGAFFKCGLLNAMDIPGSVTTIGEYAFFQSGIAEIKFGDGLTAIGACAFYNCNGLTAIELPDSVTSLGKEAFSSCSNLAEVELSRSLKSIPEYTFYSCSKLEEIIIPQSVVYIGRSAFYSYKYSYSSGWNGLKRIYFMGDAPCLGHMIPEDATVFYVPGTTGWLNIHYNDGREEWFGPAWDEVYTMKTWTPDIRKIEALELGDGTVNGRGYVTAYYRLTDFIGTPLSGQRIDGLLDGVPCTMVTDENGEFSVITPETTVTTTYPLTLTVNGYSGELQGGEQTVTVTVEPLSYSQKWSGALGVEAGASIGPSAGAGVGVVEAEAALIEFSASGKSKGTLSLEDSYDAGTRTLTVEYEMGSGIGLEMKSGVGAVTPAVEISLIEASAGVSFTGESSMGLKLENYSPQNMFQTVDLGCFLMQVALVGSNSVTGQILMDVLEVGAHNQSGYTAKLALEAGAGIGAVKGVIDPDESFELVGVGGKLVASWGKSDDLLKNTRSKFMTLACEGGLEVLAGIEFPGGKIFDGKVGSSAGVTAEYDSDDNLTELSYSISGETSGAVAWGKTETKDTTEVTYDAVQAAKIVADNESLGKFTNDKIDIYSPADLITSALMAESGEYIGTLEKSTDVTTGLEFKFPIELKAGLGLDFSVEGSFLEELSWVHEEGVVGSGEVRTTSVSNIEESSFAPYKKTLRQIIKEAIDGVTDIIEGRITVEEGVLSSGVSNLHATMSGASRWLCKIARVFSPGSEGKTAIQSYAILTIHDLGRPDSSAAVAVTLGEPYSISVYTDDSEETLVTDEELAASPVNLTLSYTGEMLAAAGVTAAADIRIFRFDSNRNVYIPVDGCVQNGAAMTVTAPVTMQGEYILATDSASPLVSGFILSDRTTDPTLSMMVSDLSGIGEFSLWLDDGPVLVDSDGFEMYYDYVSNVFTYAFEKLPSGEHTVYVQATDTLGNANAEPFCYTFTVDADAPVISNVVVPTDTVTDPEKFVVTASIGDNESVAQAVVKVTGDNGTEISAAMTESDGVWSAPVTGAAGMTHAEVLVTACDLAGNRTESARYEVTIDIPEEPDPDAPRIVVSEARVRAGKTASVCIAVKNNPGISSMKLEVAFDPTLTLTGVEYNGMLSGQFVSPQALGNPVVLSWTSGLTDVKGDWVLAFLTFSVPGDAQVGEYPVTVTYAPDDIYDAAETGIEFAVQNGAVRVEYYPSGDINGDGKVNNKDIIRLFQYLSGWDVEVVTPVLDVNGDGEVNSKDATRLLQYLSGVDVEIY